MESYSGDPLSNKRPIPRNDLAIENPLQQDEIKANPTWPTYYYELGGNQQQNEGNSIELPYLLRALSMTPRIRAVPDDMARTLYKQFGLDLPPNQNDMIENSTMGLPRQQIEPFAVLEFLRNSGNGGAQY